MARFCDEQAQDCGELVSEVDEEGEKEGGVGRELVDRVGVEGEGCCVPKGKK